MLTPLLFDDNTGLTHDLCDLTVTGYFNGVVISTLEAELITAWFLPLTPLQQAIVDLINAANAEEAIDE